MGPFHSWDVDLEEAEQIQDELRHRVILRRTFSAVHRIGGADVAYSNEGTTCIGAVVVLSFPALEEVDSSRITGETRFPYIPGLLSFREGPVLIRAFDSLKVKPDVMIFEGQGIAHPRGLGLATHLGIWLDIPSVGCTKTPLLHLPIRLGTRRGEIQSIRVDNRTVGAVLRTKNNVKPVFVSPGHKIDLATSLGLVIDCPNPCEGHIRLLHLYSDKPRNE